VTLAILLALCIGTGLPLLTALLTRISNKRVKTLLDSIVAAIGGALASLTANPPTTAARWETAGITLLLALVAAAAASVPNTPVHAVSSKLMAKPPVHAATEREAA
jgi:hypothetical protein